MDRRHFALGLAGLGAAGALAGCGLNNNPLEGEPGGNTEPGSSDGPAGSDQEIVIGSADFTESVVLAELYAQMLAAQGFNSSTKTRLGSREIYLDALRDGSVQAVPEYTGNLLQYLDQGNPAQQPEEIVTALESVIGEDLAVLAASQATDQDVYVVTRATSDQHGITALGDLTAIAAESTLGGPSELKDRPYGPPGLKEIYGVEFKKFQSYDAPAVKVKDLNDNKIQVATFFTTEAAIIDNDYVMLEDPQLMILPQQVIPLVAAPIAANEEVVAAFEAVQTALTTEDLTILNKQVDVDHLDAKTVATDYLKGSGLIS